MSNIQKKNLSSTLSATSKAILEDFKKYHAEITCTKCTTTKGTLSYTGNSSGKVPQPQFSCTSCNKSLFLSTVEREIKQAKACGIAIPTTSSTTATTSPTTNSKKRTRVNSTCFDDNMNTTTAATKAKAVKLPPNNNNNNNSSEMSALLDLVKSLQDRISRMETESSQIKKENCEIKQQLQLCTNKNAQLEKQLLHQSKTTMLHKLQSQQQQQHNNNTLTSTSSSEIVVDDTDMDMDNNDIDFPVLAPSIKGKEKEGSSSSTSGIYASKYADKVGESSKKPTYANAAGNKKSSKSTKKLEKKLKTTNPVTTNPNRIASAVRAFSTPSNEPQEYVYTYYPAKSRISREKQRKNLMALGVFNNCVFDIHYPARNVVAILTHVNYQKELVSKLEAVKVKCLDSYSPIAATSITDPKYNTLTNEEKEELAKQKHNERVVRALPHIRQHVARSIANYFFCKEGVITQEQFDNFVQVLKNKYYEEKKQKNISLAAGSFMETQTKSNLEENASSPIITTDDSQPQQQTTNMDTQ